MSSKKRKYDKIDWSDSGESEPEENIDNISIKLSDRRCPYCTHVFKSSLDLEKHEKICTIAKKYNGIKRVTCKDGQKKFLCQICCSTYKYLNLLQLHERKHEPPGGFYCKYCDFRCCHDVKLEQHKEEAHKEFLCRLCNLTFETKETYIDHIKIQHDGRDKDYKVCENCGRQFRYTEHLNYHKNTNCQTIFPFKCMECGKSFRSKGILKTHSLIHSGVKKFTCSFCPMSFICKAQVVVHERKHTGEKPYKCDICSKAFAHRESLVTHSSTHTGMKPYLCECCDARFSCVSSILAHRRTRPQTCGLPQYSTKLAKACPRPSFRSKRTAEKRVIKNARVIKTSEKEKLKEKRNIEKNTKIVEDPKVRNCNREKIADDINAEQSNSNKNGKFQNFTTNRKINSEQIQLPNTLTKSSPEITKVQPARLVKTNEKNKYNIKRRNKSEEICLDKINTKKSLGQLENPDRIQVNKVKSQLQFVNQNKIVQRTRSKRNIKIINYSEDIKEEIENNFQDIHMKDDFVIENNYIDEQQESDKVDLQIKVEIDELNNNSEAAITNNDSVKKIIKYDEIKTENENLDSKKSSNFIEINKDNNNSNNSDRFSDSLSNEDEPMIISNDESNSKSSDKIIETEHEKQHPKKSNRKLISKKKNDDIFECIDCINKAPFRRKISYEKHLRNHHNKTDNEIIEILSIKNHIPSNYSCKICGKSFTYPKSLNQHTKLHGIDGKLIIQCKSCLNYFATNSDLLEHSEKEHKIQITCLICNKKYKDIGALKAHERYAHRKHNLNDIELKKKKLTFICNKCGKLFSRKSSLITHELSKCGTEHQFKCNECGKALYSASTLKTHMMIHSGELPFLCTFCSKGFRTKAPMIVHQRMHTGEKPFQCTYCDKAFAYRENLFIHMSTHTGIKRYMCTTCSERFSCISGLKNHWRTHLDTCGADPNRTTKAVGEFMGYRKGQLENKKKAV